MMDKNIEGYEDFLKQFNSIKTETLSSLSFDNKFNDNWKYLGEANTGQWSNNLSDIILNKKIKLIPSNIKLIISDFLNVRKIVQYPPLISVQNSRFSYCWFLNKTDIAFTRKMNWDICIQYYEDESFLINVGSGDGCHNFWYLCDGLQGLQEFIEDKKLS